MAKTNLAILETYLKDIIFSEEEILSKVEMREHIFEIKDNEKSLGFISLYDLKAYVFEHEEEAKQYWVKNIDSDGWKNIYEHPFFQRRKPQLISTDNLKDADDSEFFILHKGQKIGPFEKYELMDKVESKELLLSDMVSFNAGYTWIKLYQVDGFERRLLKDNDQLPGLPNKTVLNKTSTNIKNLSGATDAISSLAFLGNQKKGKSIEREREVSYQNEMEKGAKATNTYKWLLISSLIGIIFFIFNIKSRLNSPFLKERVNTVGEQAEMLKPIESTQTPSQSGPHHQVQSENHQNSGVNDERRRAKFETRNINPVKPSRPAARKSFMETKNFIDANTENHEAPPAEDSNYYYENVAPMELDPVRAQISKENFDNGGEPVTPPENDPDLNSEFRN